MWVFGCAWKINFPEIIFSWPCVLKALTRKWFEVKIFTSNHFRTHAQRERERAFNFDFVDLRTHQSMNRSRLRLRQLCRSCLQLRRSSTYRSMNSWIDLRPRAFDFAGDPEPSRHEPTNWSLSLSLSLWFWSTHKPIYVSVWFWFFTFSLWSLVFFVVVVVVWMVVFWWFSCCVVVGFVWVVVENSIFRMLSNTWEYFFFKFS